MVQALISAIIQQLRGTHMVNGVLVGRRRPPVQRGSCWEVLSGVIDKDF